MFDLQVLQPVSLGRVRLFLVVLLAVFFASVEFASAQAGVGMRPAIIEESVEPGGFYEFSLQVSNLSQAEQTYYMFTRDIRGVQAGGVPIFADEDTEKTGYEVTEWIDIQTSEITLGPGQSGNIAFTMSVPEDATPGSHFGGVFASIEPPRLRSIGAAVGYEVATIISMRVAGDAVENARIRSFATDNYIYGSSLVDFNARVENLGNVLIRPVGPLEINNMFGKRVALLTFNDTKAGVFPESTRDFVLTWESENPGFGRYEAILSMAYGGSDTGQKTISSTATFWILPMNIIGPAFAVLAALLLIVYVAIKLYIRSRLGGSPRARRLNQRRNSGTSLTLLILIVMLVVTALFLIILLALFA